MRAGSLDMQGAEVPLYPLVVSPELAAARLMLRTARPVTVPAPVAVEPVTLPVPAGPVPCRRPECTQLVSAEFVARTGEDIHPPCRVLLAAAAVPASDSTPVPVRRRRRSGRLAGAGVGGRS